ncbi:hypothetical protein RchiOBHm_Chr1g0384271 [Rosa chinensis]|uniref:WDR11 first beta-propeller domain-containing protein n=1 Tax=Rosa chinensis TaxID=74649 RepID=A0A2P6SPW7_ROSCH|nr:hypothetical protein RchiOBHm_Chr1g0384271 [Rosa chinensis]
MSILRPSSVPSTVQDCWDCMLLGPPNCNNLESAEVSPSGLFVFPAGSSISIIDTRSMHLVVSLPMPPPLPFPILLCHRHVITIPLRHLHPVDPNPSRPRPPLHRAFHLPPPPCRQGRIGHLDL